MTEIEKFELRLRMDATITVYDGTGQATDWLKPGSEAGMTWKGMPTQEEVALRYEDLAAVASATLESVIISARARLDKELKGK